MSIEGANVNTKRADHSLNRAYRWATLPVKSVLSYPKMSWMVSTRYPKRWIFIWFTLRHQHWTRFTKQIFRVFWSFKWWEIHHTFELSRWKIMPSTCSWWDLMKSCNWPCPKQTSPLFFCIQNQRAGQWIKVDIQPHQRCRKRGYMDQGFEEAH